MLESAGKTLQYDTQYSLQLPYFVWEQLRNCVKFISICPWSGSYSSVSGHWIKDNGRNWANYRYYNERCQGINLNPFYMIFASCAHFVLQRRFFWTHLSSMLFAELFATSRRKANFVLARATDCKKITSIHITCWQQWHRGFQKLRFRWGCLKITAKIFHFQFLAWF